MRTEFVPVRPAIYAEQTLVTAILDGDYTAGSSLPNERDLADRLGVTRPTLREALQRLERDGWITIRHGKSTIVNDIWTQGGLNVLSALVRCSRHLPNDFVPNLLDLRRVIAPAYTRAAVENAPNDVIAALNSCPDLHDAAQSFAAFDWSLHHALTVASGNPMYTLILNGFAGFYEQMARVYFLPEEARQSSRAFYTALLSAAELRDPDAAERVALEVMQESIDLWRGASVAALGRTFGPRAGEADHNGDES